MKNLIPAVFAIFCTALLPAIVAAGTLHKCTEANGQVTYSDRACPTAPVAGAGGGSPLQVKGGKLDERAVRTLIHYATELTASTDHRAMCAMAAPDLSFQYTDNTFSPPKVYKGGSAAACDMQLQSAHVIRSSGLLVSVKLGDIAVSVAPNGREATAKYQSITTMGLKGQGKIWQSCSRVETVAVYGDKLLFSKSLVHCSAAY